MMYIGVFLLFYLFKIQYPQESRHDNTHHQGKQESTNIPPLAIFPSPLLATNRAIFSTSLEQTLTSTQFPQSHPSIIKSHPHLSSMLHISKSPRPSHPIPLHSSFPHKSKLDCTRGPYKRSTPRPGEVCRAAGWMTSARGCIWESGYEVLWWV
jgi:hypothetical protein